MEVWIFYKTPTETKVVKHQVIPPVESQLDGAYGFIPAHKHYPWIVKNQSLTGQLKNYMWNTLPSEDVPKEYRTMALLIS